MKVRVIIEPTPCRCGEDEGLVDADGRTIVCAMCGRPRREATPIEVDQDVAWRATDEVRRAAVELSHACTADVPSRLVAARARLRSALDREATAHAAYEAHLDARQGEEVTP